MDHTASINEGDLNAAVSAFARWRQSRQRGARIPESLWDAAVAAARHQGVGPVAWRLRVDRRRLEQRLAGAEAAGRPSSSACGADGAGDQCSESPFVAVVASGGPQAASEDAGDRPSIDIRRPDGSRLILRGMPVGFDAQAVLTAFAGGA